MKTAERPKNIDAPPLLLHHVDMKPASINSPFKVSCPSCADGVLFVRRKEGANFALSRLDHCVLCGQHVLYLDADIGGCAFAEPDPRSFDGAFHWTKLARRKAWVRDAIIETDGKKFTTHDGRAWLPEPEDMTARDWEPVFPAPLIAPEPSAEHATY